MYIWTELKLLYYKTTFHFGSQVIAAQIKNGEMYCRFCDDTLGLVLCDEEETEYVPVMDEDGFWTALACGHSIKECYHSLI